MARHVLTDEERRATQFKSGADAVKNGRKGGIASGAARRAPSLSSIAKRIAAAPITNKKNKKQILEIMGGEKDEAITNNALIVMGVYMSAASGDMKAVEKWEEWTQEEAFANGDTPADELSKALFEISEGENATGSETT